jgi:AcrR family transcriptional regulator
MLRDDGLTVEDVARRVGVSPATLYRHLPGGRSAVA